MSMTSVETLDLGNFPFQVLFDSNAFWCSFIDPEALCYSPRVIKQKVATDFANIRSVCKEWRDLVPFVEKACFLMDGFFISFTDAEMRFGLSRKQLDGILRPTYIKFGSGPIGSKQLIKNWKNWFYVSDIIPVFYESLNDESRIRNMEKKRDRKRKANEAEFQKAVQLMKQTQKIQATLRHEGMEMLGSHSEILNHNSFQSAERWNSDLVKCRIEYFLNYFHWNEVKNYMDKLWLVRKEDIEQHAHDPDWRVPHEKYNEEANRWAMETFLKGIDFSRPWYTIKAEKESLLNL